MVIKLASLNWGELAVTITKRSFTDMGLRVGSRVYLAFRASAVHPDLDV